MFNFIEKILDLIFPPVCGICNKEINTYLCKNCEKEINKITCVGENKYSNKNFSTHMYLFKYEGIIRSKIISYKFDDKPYLYKSFCEIFVKNKKVCEFLKNYDIIISVPMYKKKKNQRGYNQSELIAREIAKKLKNIEYRSDILLKIKNTANQSLLNKEQRQENLKNAYEVKNKEYISNKNILIFDDIYTTGSTANECSKMLVEAGARSIGILTIAKD